MDKTLRFFCDVFTSIVLILCIGCVSAFATIGDASFYHDYYRQTSIDELIEDELNLAAEEVANKSGIEKGAFDYALSKNADIVRIKYVIMPSVFNGIKSDYIKAEGIDVRFRQGLIDYHELNGIDYDEATIDACTEEICSRLDALISADNITELHKCVSSLISYSKLIGVGAFVVLIFLITRIFALNFGRTKAFAHIGSVLISSGISLVTMCIMNMLMHFTTRLNLTNNEIMMGAASYGADKYFRILAVVGALLILFGFIAIRFVYDYYMDKHSVELQEKIINEKIRKDAKNVSQAMENTVTTENGDVKNGNN